MVDPTPGLTGNLANLGIGDGATANFGWRLHGQSGAQTDTDSYR